MNYAALLLAIITFWGIIEVFHKARREWFERHRIDVDPPVLLWRLAKPPSWLSRLNGSRLVRLCGNTCVLLTILSAAAFYIYIGIPGILKITGRAPRGVKVVQIVVPGVTITGEDILYFLVAASIAIVLHELAHAAVASSEGLSLKSVGLALFIAIPAAFVEPDEKEFEAAPLSTKLRILGAGSAVNLVLAILGLLLFLQLVAAPGGILVTGVEPGSPASLAGIRPGMVIKAVNGTLINKTTDLTSYIYPGRNETLILTVEYRGSTVNVTVYKPAERRIIGIYFKPKGTIAEKLSIGAYKGLLSFAFWFQAINFGLAMVNAAPLFITDGAKMLEYLLREKFGKPPGLVYAFEVFTLVLLVAAAV